MAAGTGIRNPMTASSASICRCRRRWAVLASRTPGRPSTCSPPATQPASAARSDFIAKQHKKDASKATVKCAVSIGPREKGGFGLAVVLDVTDASLPQAELQSLAEEAHEKICPYSHATRGNVDVKLVTHGA